MLRALAERRSKRPPKVRTTAVISTTGLGLGEPFFVYFLNSQAWLAHSVTRMTRHSYPRARRRECVNVASMTSTPGRPELLVHLDNDADKAHDLALRNELNIELPRRPACALAFLAEQSRQ